MVSLFFFLVVTIATNICSAARGSEKIPATSAVAWNQEMLERSEKAVVFRDALAVSLAA